MEEKMQKSKENNTEKEHPQKRTQGYAIRFFGCWLLTVALAAGMFLLWIYLSFEMRLSAQVIRAGLMAVYILPCFLGARMIRRSCLPGKIFWGAFLGIAYYALLDSVDVHPEWYRGGASSWKNRHKNIEKS